MNENNRLIRVGIFYDGNYFMHVSNYYYYEHTRKARLDIAGLHTFIRHEISSEEGVDLSRVQVVDAHFFRGRQNAVEAQENNRLYSDRVFDDILMHEGVVTHYLPLKSRGFRKEEKGIDVLMVVEALELTMLKRFDVVVLIASDGDYAPLVRKINTIGSRVMVVSWDFNWTDENGNARYTNTSQDLLKESTYPMAMAELIDKGLKKSDPIVGNLFYSPPAQPERKTAPLLSATGNGPVAATPAVPSGPTVTSRIASLHNGYGFIEARPKDLYFYYADLVGVEFADLEVGDEVSFVVSRNENGPCAREIQRLEGGYKED